jgi:hypothetical protein
VLEFGIGDWATKKALMGERGFSFTRTPKSLESQYLVISHGLCECTCGCVVVVVCLDWMRRRRDRLRSAHRVGCDGVGQWLTTLGWWGSIRYYKLCSPADRARCHNSGGESPRRLRSPFALDIDPQSRAVSRKVAPLN